jgi:hypothetical protein
MNNITLIVIPGSGARQLTLSPNATLADLVSQENLHGRDMILNGSGVPASNYSNITIPQNAEIFATGSVKGNSATPSNGPSQTGRPSGGGRGNNSPRSK